MHFHLICVGKRQHCKFISISINCAKYLILFFFSCNIVPLSLSLSLNQLRYRVPLMQEVPSESVAKLEIFVMRIQLRKAVP
jgi:hypothetical protein